MAKIAFLRTYGWRCSCERQKSLALSSREKKKRGGVFYQARAHGRDQGLQDLVLTQLAQEAQYTSADVLVGVLQVVAESIAAVLQDCQHETRRTGCFFYPCTRSG